LTLSAREEGQIFLLERNKAGTESKKKRCFRDLYGKEQLVIIGAS